MNGINSQALDVEVGQTFKQEVGTLIGRNDSGTLAEYCLQGSILDSKTDDIHNRLRGLCDNVERETFIDHEITYSLVSSTGAKVQLRVSRSLAQSKMPWQLKYVGTVEAGNKACLLRNQVTVGCSENVTSFLTELGFRAEFEFLNKGYLYRKGRLKIVVSRICQMKEPGKTEQTDPMSNSHFVEASIVVPTGSEDPSQELKILAEQLKPLVQLEKIDIGKLQRN